MFEKFSLQQWRLVTSPSQASGDSLRLPQAKDVCAVSGAVPEAGGR